MRVGIYQVGMAHDSVVPLCINGRVYDVTVMPASRHHTRNVLGADVLKYLLAIRLRAEYDPDPLLADPVALLMT